MVNHFWDAQIHVSADVAFCIWQYYEATNDMDFIQKYGAEIVFEIARFFSSRVVYNKNERTYIIKGVLGPDEYHEMINNNAFTNVMAKEAISIAFKTFEMIKDGDETNCDKLLEENRL